MCELHLCCDQYTYMSTSLLLIYIHQVLSRSRLIICWWCLSFSSQLSQQRQRNRCSSQLFGIYSINWPFFSVSRGITHNEHIISALCKRLFQRVNPLNRLEYLLIASQICKPSEISFYQYSTRRPLYLTHIRAAPYFRVAFRESTTV